jgi:hypothetical protein
MRILSILVGIVVLIALAAGTAVMLRQSDAPGITTAPPGTTQPIEIAKSEADPEEVLAVAPDAKGDDKVVAYYFHWTTRCQACLDIERHGRGVMRERFVDELEAGRLEWHAYNMEQPEYEHFQAEFELSTPSLVLVRVEDGAIAQWKVLGDVWKLVEIPEDLQDYVEAETRAYLDRAFGPGRGGSARGPLEQGPLTPRAK